MTNHSSFDPSTVDISGEITLVVAKRSGQNLKGYRIAMHTDVTTELRSVCAGTLTALGNRSAVDYADDLALDPESQYLVVPSAVLVAHRAEPRRGRQPADAPEPRQIEVDPSARRVLADASSLPELDAAELKKQSFVFCAAVVGDAPDHRTAFVDKWNPYKAGISGQIATVFGDRLRRIEGPLLVFRRSFDMVVTDTTIAVLNPKAFEEVFRDIDSMKARIPVWSDAAIMALPFDDETAERVRSLAAKSARLAKQVRGLYERGVFDLAFTIEELRTEMDGQDLDADSLIVDDLLALGDEDIPVFLNLIDERLSKGWKTKTPWIMGTRAKRS